MEWDKFKIAQKFLQKANAIHPEEAGSSEGYAEALALQDVNYDCYMSCFSREDLIKRLQAVVSGKIEKPEEEEDLDEETYRATYVKQAKLILASIERGEIK